MCWQPFWFLQLTSCSLQLLNYTMKITIIAFGQIAEITGKDLTLSAADTDALKQQLEAMFPALAAKKYAIAVNRQLVPGHYNFNENDEVALMPPYSGG